MTDTPRKPKEPLLALMLSFLFSGLGHIYAGYVRRGVLIIVLPLLVGAGAIAYLIHPRTGLNIALMVVAALAVVAFGIWVLMDSYDCAKRFNARNGLQNTSAPAKRALIMIGIVIILFIPSPTYPITQYVRAHFFQAFKIPAGSMRAALREGDRILTDKRGDPVSRLKRGDVIVFRYPVKPERDFVKRLIAFAGETVEIIEGDVFIDGELVTHPKIKNNHYYNSGTYGAEDEPVRVPPGHLYVLGDNSGASNDSRFWGFLPEENLIGIAYKIYWPPERSGPLE